LKRALAPLLPRKIVERPKKGFGMPIGRWLIEGRFAFDPADTNPLLDPAFVERKFAEHRARKADHRLFLWSCGLFARWQRR
jgi:asparagine synthase (glutamine-hydrolysing)